MSEKVKLVDIIINLANRRARLLRAMSTARAVGDFEYIHINRSRLNLLNAKLDALVKCCPKHVIDEARERTNAPL